MMSVSQIVVNSLMAGYGDMALAGIGVAMKVTMITGMVCIGFGQGVQPLLGYCAGARLWSRFCKALKFSVVFSFLLSTAMTVLCYLFTRQMVGVFLTDPDAYGYAVRFARILLTTSFLFGVFYVLCNVLQAMGAATESLVINLSRQGLICIPALFLLEMVLGAEGLAWAQPVADVLSTALAAGLCLARLQKNQKPLQKVYPPLTFPRYNSRMIPLPRPITRSEYDEEMQSRNGFTAETETEA